MDTKIVNFYDNDVRINYFFAFLFVCLPSILRIMMDLGSDGDAE